MPDYHTEGSGLHSPNQKAQHKQQTCAYTYALLEECGEDYIPTFPTKETCLSFPPDVEKRACKGAESAIGWRFTSLALLVRRRWEFLTRSRVPIVRCHHHYA